MCTFATGTESEAENGATPPTIRIPLAAPKLTCKRVFDSDSGLGDASGDGDGDGDGSGAALGSATGGGDPLGAGDPMLGDTVAITGCGDAVCAEAIDPREAASAQPRSAERSAHRTQGKRRKRLGYILRRTSESASMRVRSHRVRLRASGSLRLYHAYKI
jgi:hypothetical protein